MQHLGKLGIDPSRITVSGIPINPVFALKKNKQEMRRKFGLNPDCTTIRMSTGGMGVGPIDQLATALRELKERVQVLAMCGKNKPLFDKMTAIAGEAQERVRIVPVGYTNQMDEYMSASDIVLGKPGGLTTSEALAKNLAFVVVNPIPGQEERNSDHLLEEGVGIRCNNLPALAYKLDTLLADPARISAMQANAARLAHPNSAADIVRIVSESPAGHSSTISGRCKTCAKTKIVS